MAIDNNGDRLSEGVESHVKENGIYVRFFLTDPDVRPLSTSEVTALWREKVGVITCLESISFAANKGGPGSGKNLTVRLNHENKEVLDSAGRQLAERLSEFPIVHDIDDGSAKGKRQFDIQLRPAGERMGLTSQAVANHVRHAFQGAIAVKQQRGKNEVTVRVRLPENERVTEATLEDMVIQAPMGEIPLSEAASLVPGRAYTSITRTDGRLVISVTGNVRPPSQSENIQHALEKEILPGLVADHPGLSYSFEGHQAEIRDSVSSLVTGLA